MRNPYVTGGWVSGREHYGREALLQHLLESPNSAFWVIGTRRMGKTSLLRQLEFIAMTDDRYVPLFWDLQGISDLEEMAAELIYAIEDEEERFRSLVVDIDLLRNWDVIGILRLMRRYARAAGKTLLLLMDEAEALLSIAESDSRGLARLRKVLQNDQGLRVVMASTKVLSRINAMSYEWQTSPFLLGFSLANLTGLDQAAIAALIRHIQSSTPVEVDDEQVEAISAATNNHPYLTQVLCSRLFMPSGALRTLQATDLYIDAILDGYFQNDFRWLAAGERQVLLSVASGNRSYDQIQNDTGLAKTAVEAFVFSLHRLGQLRCTEIGFEVGNAFLASWLEQNRDELADQVDASEIPDETTQQLIREGQVQEAQYLLKQLNIQKSNLGELELTRARYGLNVPLDLLNNIKQVKIEIENLEQRLALIPSDIVDYFEEIAAPVTA